MVNEEYQENLFNCKGDRPTADHANNFRRLTEYRNISFTKIIETINIDYNILRYRLRELAYLNAGITINLRDEIENGK